MGKSDIKQEEIVLELFEEARHESIQGCGSIRSHFYTRTNSKYENNIMLSYTSSCFAICPVTVIEDEGFRIFSK